MGSEFDAANAGTDISVTVANSVAGNSAPAGSGMYAVGGGGTAILHVRSSTVANNDGYGLLANGPGTTVTVTKSTINTNGNGSVGFAPGALISYGDNDTDSLGATSTLPLQ